MKNNSKLYKKYFEICAKTNLKLISNTTNYYKIIYEKNNFQKSFFEKKYKKKKAKKLKRKLKIKLNIEDLNIACVLPKDKEKKINFLFKFIKIIFIFLI